ncbi:MAG: FadR family transcriptional regulator [Chrysiogenetes bacterium]|nr:FadR family transcriptional regulator [Chrysiogenetes bacterium]
MAEQETTERAAVQVARKIAGQIRSGGMRPGTKLPAEHNMVEELGVARATVREALRFLELQGALRIKAGPGGGPVVSVPGTEHLASVLSLQLQFAGAPYQAVLDARGSIYPVLAAEAADHANHQDIELLRQSLSEMAANVEDPDFVLREHRRFQALVASASGNMVLGLFVNALHRISELTGIRLDSKWCRGAVRDCEEVISAIERGDAEAAREATQKHQDAAKRYLEKTVPDRLKEPVAWMGPDQ